MVAPHIKWIFKLFEIYGVCLPCVRARWAAVTVKNHIREAKDGIVRLRLYNRKKRSGGTEEVKIKSSFDFAHHVVGLHATSSFHAVWLQAVWSCVRSRRTLFALDALDCSAVGCANSVLYVDRRRIGLIAPFACIKVMRMLTSSILMAKGGSGESFCASKLALFFIFSPHGMMSVCPIR